MGYHYDPILCLNVPDSTSKAKDASWKAWTLYIDGKWVKSFSSSMAPIKEAQKFMKENYPGKVGKLVRNTGSSSGYSISGSEYKDAAPAGVRDANKKEGFVIHSAQIKGNKIAVVMEDLLYSPGKKEIEEFTKEEASKIKNDPWTTWKGNSKSVLEKFISSRDSKTVDKAIRMADKFTVWESDEYDDIYVSYEGGTYVLYVENRPQADGSQQKMIQLGKQEERMRG